MSAGRDPYAVLGVQRGATVRQIRAAYVARARRAHPDLVGAPGLDVMRDLNEAWALLKDAGRRAAYDATSLPPGAAAPPGVAAPAGGPNEPDRPFWTGAAGPPPGRPWGPVIDFGIFAGWSLGEIARRDPGYLEWLRDRPEAKPYRVEIEHLLNPVAEEPTVARRSRR